MMLTSFSFLLVAAAPILAAPMSARSLTIEAGPKASNGSTCGTPAIKPDMGLDRPKIVGGQQAVPYSWPWQVALFTNNFFFCGGSLIAPQWVMTAGHCFYGSTNPAGYTVKLGVNRHSSNTESGEIVATISNIYVNPKYNPSTTAWDITLLKLSNPVTYTDHISPICLPQKGELINATTNVVVTGWGTTSEDGKVSSKLMEVTVPVTDQTYCDKAYPGQIDDATMFCAGLPQGGKDSCQGDSGGPVVIQRSNGQWVEEGIVSWGQGCAEPKFPGVYSRVSAYIDWIKGYVPEVQQA